MFGQVRNQVIASSALQSVDFTVRGPLAATWGTDEDHRSRPGSCILDLVFASPSKVGELVFRNYYTAWLTVLVQVAPNPGATPPANTTNTKVSTPNRGAAPRVDVESTLGGWKLAIPRRVLMPHPHQETGSHDIISIAATESLLEWNNLQAMRLLLQQPSPVWRTFHVEEISVLRELPRRAPRGAAATAQAAFATPLSGSAEDSPMMQLRQRTTFALKKSNAPDREGPPPKDFVGLVGYEVQGLLLL